VDSINLIGDADEVQAFVQEYVDAGVQVPIITPLPWGPEPLAVIDATLRGVGH
jgi:hypothetical protein